MSNEQNISKGRIIASWILKGLLSALFIMSGVMKLVGGADVATNFARYGLEGKMTLIGTGELISVILYLFPRTSSLGVLLLSAHMGGAIATHMEHGEMYASQSIILIVVWIAHWLRNPEMLASFTKK